MPDDTAPAASPSPGLGRILARRQAQAAGAAQEPAVAVSGGSAVALQHLFVRANEPAELLLAFAHGMATLPGELADMGKRLESAHAESDWNRYGRLLRLLIDKYIRTVELDGPGSGNDTQRLRGLLGHTLGVAVASLVEDSTELQQETRQVLAALDGWRSGQPLDPIEYRVRELSHQVGVRSHGLQEQRDMLLSLFDLLLENIAELLDERSWLQGQIAAVRGLLGSPLDPGAVERTRNNLREVIYKQGLLKQGIAESKAAMKDLMGDFVEQLGGMAISTGEYHDRIAGYSLAVRQARSINDLNQLLQDVLQDTGRVQAQALLTRDHLAHARAEAEAAEQRIQALERQLEEVSSLVQVDPLTGALNRRGLEALLERECQRAQASGHPLCVALMDLDDFHVTNDNHGHDGGDRALHHLVTVARAQLRSTDGIARVGGDEFVLVLASTGLEEGLATTRRLQLALQQRPVMHGEVRIHVGFSAGVAELRTGERGSDALRRADQAMYTAKRAGKAQVQAAF